MSDHATSLALAEHEIGSTRAARPRHQLIVTLHGTEDVFLRSYNRARRRRGGPIAGLPGASRLTLSGERERIVGADCEASRPWIAITVNGMGSTAYVFECDTRSWACSPEELPLSATADGRGPLALYPQYERRSRTASETVRSVAFSARLRRAGDRIAEVAPVQPVHISPPSH